MKKALTIILSAAFLANVFLMTGCKSDLEKENGELSATMTAKPISTASPMIAPTTTEPPVSTATPAPSAAPTDYSGGLVSTNPMDVKLYPEDIIEIGLQAKCGTGQNIALQFYATVPFYGIGIHSPTWTKTEGFSVTYDIYAWDNNYYDTICNNPVLTISREAWIDGQCAQVIFENGEELPAGEYLMVALYESHAEQTDAGVYYVEKSFPGTRAYLNDEVWDGVTIVTTLFYNTSPSNPYGPLSDPGME